MSIPPPLINTHVHTRFAIFTRENTLVSLYASKYGPVLLSKCNVCHKINVPPSLDNYSYMNQGLLLLLYKHHRVYQNSFSVKIFMQVLRFAPPLLDKYPCMYEDLFVLLLRNTHICIQICPFLLEKYIHNFINLSVIQTISSIFKCLIISSSQLHYGQQNYFLRGSLDLYFIHPSLLWSFRHICVHLVFHSTSFNRFLSLILLMYSRPCNSPFFFFINGATSESFLVTFLILSLLADVLNQSRSSHF